jgi:hypothetical protein
MIFLLFYILMPISFGSSGSNVSALGDLTDITINSATANDLLRYNGSNWINQSSFPTNIPIKLGDNSEAEIKFGTSLDLTSNRITGSTSGTADLLDFNLSAGTYALKSAGAGGSPQLTRFEIKADGLTYLFNDHQACFTILAAGTPPTFDTAIHQGKMYINTNNDRTYVGTSTDWKQIRNTMLLDDNTNVTITTPATGDLLNYDGSNWVNTTLNLTGLGDVNLSTPATGELLNYDGSNWINIPATILSSSIPPPTYVQANHLGRIHINTSNDVVSIGTSSAWINPATSLNELSDVNLKPLVDGHVLTYVASTGEWTNEAPTGGSGSAAAAALPTITLPAAPSNFRVEDDSNVRLFNVDDKGVISFSAAGGADLSAQIETSNDAALSTWNVSIPASILGIQLLADPPFDVTSSSVYYSSVTSRFYHVGGNGNNKVHYAEQSNPSAWIDTGLTYPETLDGTPVVEGPDGFYVFSGSNTSNTVKFAPSANPDTWSVLSGVTCPIRYLYKVVQSDSGKLIYGGLTTANARASDVHVISTNHRSFTNLGNMGGVINSITNNAAFRNGNEVFLLGGTNNLGQNNRILKFNVSTPLTTVDTGWTIPEAAIDRAEAILVGSDVYLFANSQLYSSPANDMSGWTASSQTFNSLALYDAEIYVAGSDLYVLGGTGSSIRVYRTPASGAATVGFSEGRLLGTTPANYIVSGDSQTYSAQLVLGGLIARSSTAAVTDTLPTPAELIGNKDGILLNQTIPLTIVNTSTHNLTIAVPAGVQSFNNGLTISGESTMTAFIVVINVSTPDYRLVVASRSPM